MSTEPTSDGSPIDAALSHLGADRRRFLKRLAVGTAVAAPIVSSFSMTGMNAAYSIALSGSNTTLLCSNTGPYGPNGGSGNLPTSIPELFGPNGVCTLTGNIWWTGLSAG